MRSLTPPPPVAPWGEATRIEEDPVPRIRSLRFFRLAGTLGIGVIGLGLLGVSLLILRGSGAFPPLFFFGAMGALLALAPGCWLALTLTLQKIPDRIAFDDQRVMVHLLDGEVREARWIDPTLALDLLNIGGSDFSRGTVLLTVHQKKGPFDASITLDGARALRTEANRQGLRGEVTVETNSPHEWGRVEIRRPAPSAEGSPPAEPVPPPVEDPPGWTEPTPGFSQ
jgi:hypothetical protein